MQTAAERTHSGRTTIVKSGLWRIQSDGAVPLNQAWNGPLTVLVPSEKILTAVIDLPLASRRKRIEAAPFAVEGMISEPLDRVHVALGMEVAPHRHLCAVAGHSDMQLWIAELANSGLEQCVLMPDALALPLPPVGAWRVAVESGRAVVRTDDGAGFALDVGALPMAWEAAGRPGLIAEGDPLPDLMRDGLDELSLQAPGVPHPTLFVPPIDLRQGRYAAARAKGSPWRAVALAVAAGAAAHLALAVLDVAALSGMADRREVETRRLLSERQPGLAEAPDLPAAVDQIAPVAAAGEGPVTHLLGRTGRALTRQALDYRTVSYDAAGLTLAVTAPDAAALDGAVATLNRAALPARAAAEPMTVGGANAVITIAGAAR